MVSFVHSSKLYRMYNHIVSTIYRDRLASKINDLEAELARE